MMPVPHRMVSITRLTSVTDAQEQRIIKTRIQRSDIVRALRLSNGYNLHYQRPAHYIPKTKA